MFLADLSVIKKLLRTAKTIAMVGLSAKGLFMTGQP